MGEETVTTMISKFPGTCVKCKRRIAVGTTIEWARGVGASHVDAAACAAAAPAAAAPTVALDLSPILAFLQAAQARGLKRPSATFLAPGGGELRLSLASAASKNPGCLYVRIGDDYRGLVTPSGQARGALVTDVALQQTLLRIARDPASAAREFGSLTCRCSFCHLPLTDEGSVEVGYGPVCADHWGLPHKPRGTRVLTQPVPVHV